MTTRRSVSRPAALHCVLAVVVSVALATTAACADRAGSRRTTAEPPSPSAAPTSTTAAPTTATSTSAAPTTTPPTTGPAGCTGALGGPETLAYEEVPIGTGADLVSLDVYRRAGATGCPVLVWVHGGGWARGDKAGKAIDTKAALAGRLGAVLISVNYRLVTADGANRWPVPGQDVAAAVAWVIDHGDDLGIDPANVTLMGHSAGAHLVSIVATDPGLLNAVGADRDLLRCLVSLDSAAYEITPAQVASTDLYRRTFGDDPATLAAASPMRQVDEHPDGVPNTLVVTRGAPARVAEARAFAAAVAGTGAEGRVVEATGYTHEQVNTRLGVPGEQLVTPPVEKFLEACFA